MACARGSSWRRPAPSLLQSSTVINLALNFFSSFKTCTVLRLWPAKISIQLKVWELKHGNGYDGQRHNTVELFMFQSCLTVLGCAMMVERSDHCYHCLLGLIFIPPSLRSWPAKHHQHNLFIIIISITIIIITIISITSRERGSGGLLDLLTPIAAASALACLALALATPNWYTNTNKNTNINIQIYNTNTKANAKVNSNTSANGHKKKRDEVGVLIAY